MQLYRYIPFEIFIDILINKKITLLSPSLWEDTYEGWFWKYFTNSPKAGNSANIILDSVFAQCWSRNKDSAALWSIYSYGKKAVMIETTKEYLDTLEPIKCKEMNYTENASIDIDDIVAMITNPCVDTLIFPFTKKRSDFLHENEVRIFAMVSDNLQKKNTIDIPIPNVSGFISSVTVHPFADEWYVKIVESVCRQHGILFSGKSHLYDMEDGGDR